MSENEELWGDVRSLVHGEASKLAWRRLLNVLAQWPQEQVHEVISYVDSSVESWPSLLKRPSKSMDAQDPAWRLVRVVEGVKNLRQALVSSHNPCIEHYIFDGISSGSSRWSTTWSQSPVFAHAKSIKVGSNVMSVHVALVLLGLVTASYPPELEELRLSAYVSGGEKGLLDRALGLSNLQGLRVLELSNVPKGFGGIEWAHLPALEHVVLGGPPPEELTPGLQMLARHARPSVVDIDGELDLFTAQLIVSSGWRPTQLKLRYVSVAALEALVKGGGLARTHRFSCRLRPPSGYQSPSHSPSLNQRGPHVLDMLLSDDGCSELKALNFSRATSSRKLNNTTWGAQLEAFKAANCALFDGFWVRASDQGWGQCLRDLRLSHTNMVFDDFLAFLSEESALEEFSLTDDTTSLEQWRLMLSAKGLRGVKRLHVRSVQHEYATWTHLVASSVLPAQCKVFVTDSWRHTRTIDVGSLRR